jgi:uncharacterized protein YndB with AHSA1/START domain
MTLDVARLIGALSREATSCIHDGKPARVVAASRIYDTDREDLWDALTNRERIPRWFLPISGDLRLGGRYQFEGNAGGEITTCDRPELLAVTWVMHGSVSWVNVTLSVVSAEQTLLRLEHIAHVPEEFWDQFGPGAVGVGWELGLMGLDQHLAKAGASVDPKTAQAWLASAPGKGFIRLSSEAWGRASRAGGTDPAQAAAAAARTTAFYTGEESAGAEPSGTA